MTIPLVNPPKQDRSRQTLERILSVTEELLDEETFESISVQAIVTRAKTSVGAFYTRFRDKSALLPLLYMRYDRDLAREMAALQRRRGWRGRELPELVGWIVRQIIRLFGRRKNLMRALALYVREHRDAVDAETIARRREQFGLFIDALLAKKEAIGHPDPERAVEFMLYFVGSVVRERLLFTEAPHTTSMGASVRELEREVTRMALGYLGVREEPTRKKKRR